MVGKAEVSTKDECISQWQNALETLCAPCRQGQGEPGRHPLPGEALRRPGRLPQATAFSLFTSAHRSRPLHPRRDAFIRDQGDRWRIRRLLTLSSPASSAPRPSSGIGGPCSAPLVTLRLRADGATVCKVFEGCFRGRDLICHKDPEAPQRLRPATGLGNGEGLQGRQVWGLLEKRRTWTRTEGLSVAFFFFFSPFIATLNFFSPNFLRICVLEVDLGSLLTRRGCYNVGDS